MAPESVAKNKVVLDGAILKFAQVSIIIGEPVEETIVSYFFTSVGSSRNIRTCSLLGRFNNWQFCFSEDQNCILKEESREREQKGPFGYDFEFEQERTDEKESGEFAEDKKPKSILMFWAVLRWVLLRYNT